MGEGGPRNSGGYFLGSRPVGWTGLGCEVAKGTRLDRWGERLDRWGERWRGEIGSSASSMDRRPTRLLFIVRAALSARLSLPPARRGLSTEPTASAMAGSGDWKKAQAERLEEVRKKELGLRETWWQGQRAKWEEEQKRKEEDDSWTWGSWSWSKSQWDWHQEGQSASSGLQERPGEAPPPPPPEPVAEPTASVPLLAIEDFTYPNRNHEEDLAALRAAAITPVSFAPQRHVTMALGRPVVVLSWL